MSDTIFEGTTPVEEKKESVSTPAIPEELAPFIGEGKKYKDIETALKSVPHAQSHISKLEEDMKALKEELEKRRSAEELLAELRASKEGNEGTPPSALSEEDIAAIAGRTIEAREQARLAKANAERVASSLRERFGDKAPELYAQKAKELGMEEATLNIMALKYPDAVLAYFPKPTTQGGKLHSSVNTAALPTTGNTQPKKSIWSGDSNTLLEAWRAARPTT